MVGVFNMAIDEKKLIDELTEKIDEVLDDLEKDESYMPLHGYWYGLTLARRIVLKQPKLSLETKTSDNDVPDTNVGKWIPCSERLPKQNERIIGTFYDDEVCRAYVGETTYFPDKLYMTFLRTGS